jgi:hypothetical protein
MNTDRREIEFLRAIGGDEPQSKPASELLREAVSSRLSRPLRTHTDSGRDVLL